jgi:hypothetical protein
LANGNKRLRIFAFNADKDVARESRPMLIRMVLDKYRSGGVKAGWNETVRLVRQQYGLYGDQGR